MPPVPTTKAATPQTTPAAKGTATNGAATPSSRPTAPGANGSAAKTAVPPVGAPKKGFAAPPAATGAKKSMAGPAGAAGGTTPGTFGGAPSNGAMPNSAYGAGMPNSGYGTGMPNSAYGGSFMQQPGGAGAASGNPGGYGGSMYGMQNNGSMYPGMGMSSMYGTQGGGNNNGMYSSGYGTSMMGPMGGGSMYGPGSMGGGGGYGLGSSFGGSLYGGTMYGAAGSLYGTGGSLYGSNDPQALMSSMYGSRNGSIYGGFGSMYSVGAPHTGLGTVQKYAMPGFSYSFGSNLGATPYHRSSFTDGAAYSSKRDNSFRATSKMLRDEERDPAEKAKEERGLRVTQREKEIEEGKKDRQRGSTGMDKDGKDVDGSKSEGAGGATDAAKDGDGRKPESIMKKRTSVEAPKSPPSTTRAVKAGTAPAPVLSADFRIHNVAVVEKSGSGPAKVTKQGDSCVVGGKSYAMDEVLECAPKEEKPLAKSRHIQDMLEHVLAGHNTALLISDDGKATAASQAAVESTVAKLMEELQKPARNSYAGVSASMCGLHSNNNMRDLGVDGARPKLMEVGNSPLFGPAVMNVTSEPVKSGEDFHKFFEAALKRGEKETLMVCMLTVKQVREGAAEGKEDVFLSSVFIGISRQGPKEYYDIVEKVSSSSHDLFRYAVDGPSVCVHVLSVSQALDDAQVLSDCAKIGEVQNTAPRSGNVRRFVDFTEEQLKRMRERSDTATGADKRELEGHVKRLNLILEDAQKLLADPKNTEAKLYRLESEADTTPAAAAAAAAAAATTTAAAAAATSKADGAKEGEKAASPREVKATTPAGAENGAAAAASKSRAAPKESNEKAATASPAEKPRSTNVATVAIVDAVEARAYAVKDTTITAGGRPFTVDEVVERKDVTEEGMDTPATEKVLAAFLKGYNGAVVASDSAAVAANGMHSPTMCLVFAAVRRALAKPGNKGVKVSIALVRDTGKAADLTSTGSAVDDIELASSPLFGPVVHNAVLHRVHSVEELQVLVLKARENVAAAEWDEHCVVHVTVVHCFAEKEDVLVSSLLATFATNNNTAYGPVLEQRSSNGLGDLYRYAFGGAATTAFVVSVGSEDEVSDVVNALSTQSTAGAVRNRSPRQGSIKNFITYTASSLQKRKEHLTALPADASEQETLPKVIAQMSRMLDDHRKVMDDPKENFPHAYTAESGVPKDTTVSPAPPTEKAAAAAKTTPASAAAAAGVAATPKTATTPSTANGARSRAAPAEAAKSGAGAAEEAAKHEDPAASGFTEPRVVVFVDREVAPEEKKLSLGDKDYAVDEVVRRVKGSTGNSAAIAEIDGRLSGVHNCALISASSVAEASSKEEPVWAIFEQCLRSAMAAGKPGEDVRADLTFTVVTADEVRADLLAAEPLPAPRPLEVASSPIYGPRVHGVTTATVLNAEELVHVLGKMHERAAAHMTAVRTQGALMAGTAVVRRRAKDGDVEVASLMGTLTGPSAKAYQEALDKEPVMRRTLLNCAYGGPSATVTILNLGAEDRAAQGMVATAVALSKKQRNLVSRSGSVLAFVRYTESTMKRELNLAGAASGEAKERHTQKAERLRPVAEDHRRLLEDFNAPIPAYPATRSGRPERERTPSTANSPSGAAATARSPAAAAAVATPGAEKKSTSPAAENRPRVSPAPAGKKDASGPNRIHSVVVVTPSRNSAEPGPHATIERADETHVKAVIAGANRECECDEAVLRADSASVVRADMLSAAAQQFIGGFNTALLCCDLAGSNAGQVSCLRLVHHAVEAKPANAELYFVINGVKGGEARDMLQPGSTYAAMKLANSPVFGPWVHGAEMQTLNAVGDFDGAFGAACAAAAKDKAMVIVNLVLKAIQDDNGKKDVVVSSLLVSLVTDPRAYAELVNAPPKSDRKLFQYAVQGSCFTVGMLGLSEKVAEDGLEECLATFEKMRTIENRPMRNGSVRRFLSYSLNAAADVKQKLPELTDERQRAMYEQRLASLEVMVSDSRMLLDSPKGRPLKVYL